MGWRQKAPGIVGAGVDCRIGPARAHLHRWSISNLGRRRNHSAWRHGRGGVIAKVGLREEQLDSLAVLLQPTQTMCCSLLLTRMGFDR